MAMVVDVVLINVNGGRYGDKMNESKICPFMSKPVVYKKSNKGHNNDTIEVVMSNCVREKCMAWHKYDNCCQLIEKRVSSGGLGL